MEASKTLEALQVTIPVEGVWFDRGDNPDGGAWRVYWRNGVPMVQARAHLHNDPLLGGAVWLVTVLWVPAGGSPAEHTFGPYRERATAVAMVDAIGIGMQTMVEAQHISLIPGAKQIVKGHD
jgi:hypothetical protein